MMATQCIDPLLCERLLEELRGTPPALPPELAGHMEECDACRLSAERAKRLAAAWSSLEPTAAEVAAARRRFAVRHPQRRSMATLPATVAVGLVLAGTVAFAASRVGILQAPHRSTPSVSAPAAVETAERASVPQGVRRAEPASVDSAQMLPDSAPTVAASLESRPATTAITTALPAPPAPVTTASPARPIAPSIAAPPEHGAESEAPTPPPPPAAAAAPEAPAASPWEIAAAAMRAGNYAVAERAFDELAHSSDARTRDEARLARAQVLLAEGRRSEAIPEFQSLAETGATPLVRARAADALVGTTRE